MGPHLSRLLTSHHLRCQPGSFTLCYYIIRRVNSMHDLQHILISDSIRSAHGTGSERKYQLIENGSTKHDRYSIGRICRWQLQ